MNENAMMLVSPSSAGAEKPRVGAPTHTIEELRRAIRKQPLHRHLYRKVLVYLEEERSTEEVESFVAAQPEFEFAVQPEGRFLLVLEGAGGIARIGSSVEEDVESIEDAEASPATAEPAAADLGSANAVADAGLDVDAGLEAEPTPPEALEMKSIVGERWIATELGAEYVARTDPATAIHDLVLEKPERTSIYLAVLAACAEAPRSLKEITDIVRAQRDAAIAATGSGDALPSIPPAKAKDLATIQPSVFIDKLERAGGLQWRHSWEVTDEGRECLQEMTSQG